MAKCNVPTEKLIGGYVNALPTLRTDKLLLDRYAQPAYFEFDFKLLFIFVFLVNNDYR